MTALCVDDEELLLDTLVWAVSSSPDITSVAPFCDELDALKWAGNNHPDIAFLDVRLHSMDGLALSEKLKEKYPDLRRTLVEADAADVLETVTGGYSVNAALIECDYFAALDGNETAIRQFAGEYMIRYSWAEYTCSALISKFM